MRAVFIHDHNFVYDKDSNLYYDGSGGAFDENLWKRYLGLFDSLMVIGRKIDRLPNKMVVSSTDNVCFQLIQGAGGVRNIIKSKKRIKQELKNAIEAVDFAIIRLPSTLGRWAFDICVSLKKNYVLEIVGDPFEAYWYHGSWLGKFVAPIELLRLKRIVCRAQNVIYVTQDKLQRRYPCFGNTCAISNVRLEEVVAVENVEIFYRNEASIFKIGLIGSFHVKYKGHVEALKALKILKEKGYTSVKLHLVGTGDTDWVRELIKEYGLNDFVKIVGSVRAGKDGIFPFLDDMHLYVHPSKTEGLPRVILEAMSRGKVSLGSDVGGTSELLGAKYIHQPGDWQKLAKQIEEVILASQEQKISMALNNLKVAQGYVESILQQRRMEFIGKIIRDESN